MQYDNLYDLQGNQKHKMDCGGLCITGNFGFYSHFFSSTNLEDNRDVKKQTETTLLNLKPFAFI